jgi:hypothetical protein
MYRNKVLLQDAIVAVLVMESSTQTSALVKYTPPLRSMFPDDPDDECILFTSSWFLSSLNCVKFLILTRTII